MTPITPARARLTIPTRADLLIEAAEKRAKRYSAYPSEQVNYECGLLRGEVRNLCAELDAFKYVPSPSCHYLNLMMGSVPVVVGYGADGDDEFSVNQVWCNGQQIDMHLSAEALEQLRQDAWDQLDREREDAEVDAAVANREAAWENAEAA